jgi:hypothetical protein
MSKLSSSEPSLSHAHSKTPATPAESCAHSFEATVFARAASVPPTSLGFTPSSPTRIGFPSWLHWLIRTCSPLNSSPGISWLGV